MDDRICGTCRHFEWASQPGRGWCRNPRLYTATQSQPVSEFELSCASRQGDFWEASDDFVAMLPIVAEPESPVIRSLEYDEHDVLSGGSQMRGSSSDQPRSSDDPAYDQPEISPKVTRVSSTGSGGSERVPPPSANLGLGTASGGSGDRPPSYQTEERYWTDYLRIALPIAGLLLLLSVFWFWASSFIGDDNNATQTPVVAINVTPQDAVTLTPTLADVTVLNTPTTGAITEPTQPAVTQPTQPAVTEPTQAPVTEPTTAPTQATTGQFAADDLVIVNDNDVNMRTDPSTSADVVDTLSQGSELRILSATSTDAEGYTWWNVSDDALGVQGWVAGQFLEK